jgi:hypothetical protein
MPERLNSVGNEGHFTLDAERDFRLCLTSHCSAVTQVSHMALTVLALQAVQDRLKSVINVGHFTLEAEQFIARNSPRIAVGWLKEAKNTHWACARNSVS